MESVRTRLVRAGLLVVVAASVTVAAALGLACGDYGTSSNTGDASADASGVNAAVGTIGAPCFPNLTCFPPLQCLGGSCEPPGTTEAAPDDAGASQAGGGCGTIPAFTSACFAGGHNACPDGTCVDFTEAGCPPGLAWPLQCGKNADCADSGYCCAGASFAGTLVATATNPCVVDTTTNSFYTRATVCSPSPCTSPVCATNADCGPSQHCAIMEFTSAPAGPAVGVCVD